MPASSPFRPTPEGFLLSLRVTPNAGRDCLDGIEQRDDGTAVLRLRVSAVPDKGKANAAVLALLAKSLGIPKSSLTLVSGELSRFKTVSVVGDIDILVSHFSTLG
ncbi:DUF167 family protein [Devosia sp. BK]|nr:DUF167 family protein [Devosia sp. BK]